MKLLVIEDDATTGAYVARGLREEGHVVDLVTDGRAGLIAATGGGHDVLVVDRMLPDFAQDIAGRWQSGAGTVANRDGRC